MLLAGQSVQVTVEDQHHRTPTTICQAPPGGVVGRKLDRRRGIADTDAHLVGNLLEQSDQMAQR